MCWSQTVKEVRKCIHPGYHLPHKDEEYTTISELEHSYDFIKQTVLRLNQRFPHNYKSETQRMIEASSFFHGLRKGKKHFRLNFDVLEHSFFAFVCFVSKNPYICRVLGIEQAL